MLNNVRFRRKKAQFENLELYTFSFITIRNLTQTSSSTKNFITFILGYFIELQSRTIKTPENN